MTRAMGATQALAEITLSNLETILIGIDLCSIRHEYSINTCVFKSLKVLPIIVRIGIEVGAVVKLLWIDKYANDGKSILFAAGFYQRHMPLVQSAHRRYKTHRGFPHGSTPAIPFGYGSEYFH